jgi:ABC-type branched-subunit amino acid transport system ATPase component
MPILECREIAKYYGALAAVDGVSLTVQPGETIGIGGPNGAGKTTFFDMISGLTPVSRGQDVFEGQAITGVPPQ